MAHRQDLQAEITQCAQWTLIHSDELKISWLVRLAQSKGIQSHFATLQRSILAGKVQLDCYMEAAAICIGQHAHHSGWSDCHICRSA